MYNIFILMADGSKYNHMVKINDISTITSSLDWKSVVEYSIKKV